MSEGGTSVWLRGVEIAFTGRLASMPRREAESLVVSRGAVLTEDPRPETAFLVVGDHGWPLRDDGRITRKLEAATRLRDEGAPLAILGEEEFLERMGLRTGAGEPRRVYTIAQLARILRVPSRVLRSWVRRGLLTPVDTVHRLSFFDFRQASGARTLIDLLRKGVSPSTIRQSLRNLRAWLPDLDAPFIQMAVLERDGQVLVRLEGGELAETSGQLQFEFLEPGTSSAGSALLGERSPARSSTVGVIPDGPQEEESNVVLRPIDRGATDVDRQRRLEARHAQPWQRTISLPQPQKSADQWFQEALDHEDTGELEMAEAAYREALLAGGPQPEFCFNLANVLYSQGRREQAMERYHQALELDPTYVEAWNNLANVLTELGSWQEAIRAYRKALEVAPGYADAHYNLAETLDQLGRREEADHYYQAYLGLDPHSPWADVVRRRLSEAAVQ